MPNESPGCGQAEHPVTCLCDVKLTGTLPVADIDHVRDSWCGPKIAERYGFSAPWTADEMLDFFQASVNLHDEVASQLNPTRADLPHRFQPTVWSNLARQMMAEGHKPAAIRDAIREHHGIEVRRDTISRMGRHWRAKVAA